MRLSHHGENVLGLVALPSLPKVLVGRTSVIHDRDRLDASIIIGLFAGQKHPVVLITGPTLGCLYFRYFEPGEDQLAGQFGNILEQHGKILKEELDILGFIVHYNKDESGSRQDRKHSGKAT